MGLHEDDRFFDSAIWTARFERHLLQKLKEERPMTAIILWEKGIVTVLRMGAMRFTAFEDNEGIGLKQSLERGPRLL